MFNMCYIQKCAKCNKMATEIHHLLSQTKLMKKLYGELIHHESNLQHLCYHHHHNEPVDKKSEVEFCRDLGIMPRSKCARIEWQNLYGTAYL